MASAVTQYNVQVYLGARSYDIFIVTDFLSSLGTGIDAWFDDRIGLPPGARKAMIVTDENVAEPHAADVRQSLEATGWSCDTFVMPPGEPSKSLDTVAQIYDRLVAMQAGRQVVVFAVGGGVVGDTAGFVAATYTRGVPLVQVPTTLLAQTDSAIGGKVGINHPVAKNIVGAFHQPMGVVVDTATLNTLPEREYRSGLAEVVKYGMILDAEFFEFLERNIDGLNDRTPDLMRKIITRSCRLKADIVEEDEYEQSGQRAILNYGHTFAHAFEALAGYGLLLHGEAVAVGMLYASRLAERLGMVGPEVTERQRALLAAVGLPTTLPESLSFSADEMLARMQLDKKAVGGRLRFVLPTEIGHVQIVSDIDEAEVRAVLEGH